MLGVVKSQSHGGDSGRPAGGGAAQLSQAPSRRWQLSVQRLSLALVCSSLSAISALAAANSISSPSQLVIQNSVLVMVSFPSSATTSCLSQQH